MEDYAAKMARKHLSELRRYLTHWSEYREIAVVAALDELEKRGEPLPADIHQLRDRLRVDAVRQAEEEARAETLRLAEARREAESTEQFSMFAGPNPDEDDPSDAPGATTATLDRPRLYSPTVILWFSVLFSFFTGGLLLALNLRRLRQFAAAWGVAGFCVLYGALIYGVQGRLGPMGSFLNLPAALVFNLWFWPRYIGFRREFKPRTFVWPLLICLGLSGAALWWLWSQGMLPTTFSALPPRPAH